MTQQEIARRLEEVRSRMQRAIEAAGRKPGQVLLCAASKTQSPETVALAAGLDIDLFGENRVQELVDKFDKGAYGGKRADMIGHLQTNKVRQTVGRAGMIQSVDSEKLLRCIQAEAARQQLVQPVLLEINIGGRGQQDRRGRRSALAHAGGRRGLPQPAGAGADDGAPQGRHRSGKPGHVRPDVPAVLPGRGEGLCPQPHGGAVHGHERRF